MERKHKPIPTPVLDELKAKVRAAAAEYSTYPISIAVRHEILDALIESEELCAMAGEHGALALGLAFAQSNADRRTAELARNELAAKLTELEAQAARAVRDLRLDLKKEHLKQLCALLRIPFCERCSGRGRLLVSNEPDENETMPCPSCSSGSEP